MEEIDKNSGGCITALDVEAESSSSGVFAQLKSYCINLLELLQNPNNNKHPSTLPQLLHFLRNSPSSALQPFLDYTLFPLLLLLDAAVDCRSQRKVDSEEKLAEFNVPKMPHKVSDTVVEGVLQCLEELLNKCHLGSVDQMVVVLKKLTYGALLSPSEAAEEFRGGIISCFRALLLSLHPCSFDSCSCKQIFGSPALLAGRDLQDVHFRPSENDGRDLQVLLNRPSEYNLGPEECLLAFLQSQIASAAVGHWLSLLLKAADTEAARGHRGSAKLRIEAFLTLRVLVAKVGTAEALAFFLPGVVSQFAKVFHVTKTMISGAAGSVGAIDQAIRGLAEYLMIVLQDDANIAALDISRNVVTDFNLNINKSTESILEELRHLPVKVQGQTINVAEDSSGEVVNMVNPQSSFAEKRGIEYGNVIGSLHVNRTKEWIEKTSAHVDKLLCAAFPHICVHPAKKVRQALLVAIRGLLSNCSYTLKESRLMLLECLCVFVCDDSEEVSAVAQEFLEYLFSSSGKLCMEHDVAEIFDRLIEKLPKVVLGSEESYALLHAQQLLVVIYYSGPRLVVEHLLRSPITAARFLDVFALCLSQNSAFAGSLDKLISARLSSTGYLHSISELKAGICFTSDDRAIMKAAPLEVPKFPGIQDIEMPALEIVPKDYELPRMPPWFVYVGSQKLYQALAGILRLVGLSLMADFRSEGSLSVVADIPLGYLRKLISEVRKKHYGNESWQSWYYRTGSGRLLRQASTAACMLNEMIFGVSNQAVDMFAKMFKSTMKREEVEKLEHPVLRESNWKVCQDRGVRSHFIDCIGTILHEYLSPEVWDLPIEHIHFLQQSNAEAGDVNLHFFSDTAMLHQVIIDGIGIFNMCLGKDFSTSGFLHLSLYLLLEKLVCSNFKIRSASDAVLHVLADTSGYRTVGHLVLANSDHVIDSICRQLRHLDLHPHVPNVLAAMLSYIGAAHKILPLLEEPMRSVSLELEILGRHQHPDLTIPFLKAVAEIAKASKHEACSMCSQAVFSCTCVKCKMSEVENRTRMDSGQCSRSHDDDDDDIDMLPMGSEAGAYFIDDGTQMEQWESILLKLNDSKRYRRTVGSIAGSCLLAATPLLASVNQVACLVALDIVEDCIVALARVEEAYRHEKETKEAIERVIQLCSYHHLQDTLDATEEGTDENRLLPAMNKIWPFLVVCVRNKNPVAVRRCLDVVSHVVQICGGDFFSRRFHNDGPHFWKLLITSPFQKKPISKEDRTPLQLPYRSTPIFSEDSVAEVSNLKVQVAALNMIANLSRNKRSASALEVVLKKVSGLVVGIACSGVIGLRDASVNALMGLASIDPDLIWLLLADVYYSLKRKDLPSSPTPDLPDVCQMLPPPLSPEGYLYVQYGGQGYGFDVNFVSVETVFKQFHSQVLT